jgi:ssDNA-binding Zn-finger/Zn-ribbon topoisomerase 1/predicted  nucleic acid-binding Zn-ribbon protein
MPRPYFQASITDLEALFEQHRDDTRLLAVLLDELEQRKTPKAVGLKDRVVKRFAAKKTDVDASNVNPPPRPEGLRQSELALDPAMSATRDIPPDLFADHDGAAEDRAPDPAPKRKVSRIRKPGRLPDVPDARPSFTSNKVDLKLAPDAPLIQRYIKSLASLVGDMRRKNSGMRTVTVTDGRRIAVDIGGYGYQFVFDGDETLFEGAAIVADVAGQACEGQITSVGENRITISLREDFGAEIAFCILRIDNTAMIEALRKRFEEISRGEVTNFNLTMASAVIHNIGVEKPATALQSTQTGRLRRLQAEAASKALSNEIFYLWGPPGTGKTFTLSSVTGLLFGAGKKTLICSNTNQAVDQVLYALCKELGPQHPAMEAGQIVRIGKIAFQELTRDYNAYVTLDGITERKSGDLKRRKEQLESEVEPINAVAARAQRTLADFQRLDAIVRSVEINTREANNLKLRKESYESELRALHQNIQNLRGQLKAFEDAWAIKRRFMRQPDAIHADIRKADTKIGQTAEEVKGLDAQIGAIQRKAPDLERAMIAGRAALAHADRRAAEREVSAADAKKAPLNQEIAAINGQLADIQKSIIEQARIVGATVTRLYLSPKMFTNFDVVIIDEASMVLLPALFNASGLAREKVIVSGDFRQLPPIVQTDEKAILAELEIDVFGRAGITNAVNSGTRPKRTVMLEQQSRMHDHICQMISGPMYRNRLQTFEYRPETILPPAPFETTLTVIDTSTILPFVNRDPVGSRYNLMHGLALRNLVHRFQHDGFLTSSRRLGICSPFAAQAKLLKRLIADLCLGNLVDAGTVHRYQGNEKEMMVIDIPDGLGEPRPGWWLDAEQPDDDGAKLINVAISRSQHHLVFIANVDYLDKKLPAQSLLRGMLSYAQAMGRTIDVRDVLSYYPIIDDLRSYGRPIDLDPNTLRTGLYNQHDFDKVCIADLAAAERSILIFSGFVTPQRTRAYEGILRSKIAERVAVRCVARPPHNNGSIPYGDGRAALNALETMGCIVDTRKDTHQKLVIVDGEILWFGSLNPLSHTTQTGEVMARLVSRDLAQQMAAFVAIKPSRSTETYANLAMIKENPPCARCGGRTYYVAKARHGAFWRCEEQTCEWTESATAKKKTSKLDGADAPSCPECGEKMVPRSGQFGDFYGCSNYPRCTGTITPNRSRSAKPSGVRGKTASRRRTPNPA